MWNRCVVTTHMHTKDLGLPAWKCVWMSVHMHIAECVCTRCITISPSQWSQMSHFSADHRSSVARCISQNIKEQVLFFPLGQDFNNIPECINSQTHSCIRNSKIQLTHVVIYTFNMTVDLGENWREKGGPSLYDFSRQETYFSNNTKTNQILFWHRNIPASCSSACGSSFHWMLLWIPRCCGPCV